MQNVRQLSEENRATMDSTLEMKSHAAAPSDHPGRAESEHSGSNFPSIDEDWDNVRPCLYQYVPCLRTLTQVRIMTLLLVAPILRW